MILAAGLALAQQQGWVGEFNIQFWMLAFGALALVFFIRYLLAGLRYWGWLFPVCIFLGLTGILWLSTTGYREDWIAAPFFGGIAVPFLVAFAVDFRKNWWALIPALSLIMVGLTIISTFWPRRFIAVVMPGAHEACCGPSTTRSIRPV